MSSNRRKARELVLRALYSQEMSDNPLSVIIEDMILNRKEEESITEFAVHLLKVCIEHETDLDKLIVDKAQNWDFERIAILDKLVMRVAICEFLHFEDIPPKVSIDEAIEIAKKYSTEGSGQFINGILDSVLLELRNQNLLKKSGRGLNED